MIQVHDNKQNLDTFNLATIKELFPDADTIEPGNWSKYGKIIKCIGGYGDEEKVEIGLYREPINEEDKDISGTLTLQIFEGDDVILCRTIL